MENLRNNFVQLMNAYAGELAEARKTNNYKRPFGSLVRRNIAEEIREHINEETYIVKGSVGAGRWTDVPWVAIFDKRITTSAQRGVYIVYLLNKDTKSLYLTLNQGATNVSQNKDGESKEQLAFTGIASTNNAATTNALKERAVQIRTMISNSYGAEVDGIQSGSSAYDAGCIYYKEYHPDTIPEDEKLFDDLNQFLDMYREYYEMAHGTPDKEAVWWPSKEEYDPGFSKNEWVEVLNNPNIIGPVWGGALAMFYAYGGEGTCTQIGRKYREDPPSIRAKCMNLGKRIQSETNCPVYKDEKGKIKYWPIMFLGRGASEDEEGSYVWKLRPELYEALTEFDILKYLPDPKDIDMTIQSTVSHIKKYIAGKGFTYSDGLVENFYLSLKSKPFVILAGTSGTGKTRLVKLFAEAIGAEYKMVAVRPDWSDSSDLFGHVDLNGNYVSGAILDFIHDAQEDPENPYILCLDEMNLARVEYYLSDFLSVIETRDLKGEKIVSEPLVATDKYGTDEQALQKYGEISFPQNLYLVGTVNMDETTFPFSKKVLDRANTIEFNYVDLNVAEYDAEQVEPQKLQNEFLKSKYLLLSQTEGDRGYVNEINSKLQIINDVLQKANLHVGYRVRDEIVFYMLNNKEAELLSEEDAMDNAILQKILPRIQGSSNSIKLMLCDLFKIFAGDYEGYQTQSNDTAAYMIDHIKKNKPTYRKSAEKIAFMVKRFEEDGFTSYWL